MPLLITGYFSITNLIACSPTQLLPCSSAYSPTGSPAHLLTCSLIPLSLGHFWLTNSLNHYLFAHSPTHICSPSLLPCLTPTPRHFITQSFFHSLTNQLIQFASWLSNSTMVHPHTFLPILLITYLPVHLLTLYLPFSWLSNPCTNSLTLSSFTHRC